MYGREIWHNFNHRKVCKVAEIAEAHLHICRYWLAHTWTHYTVARGSKKLESFLSGCNGSPPTPNSYLQILICRHVAWGRGLEGESMVGPREWIFLWESPEISNPWHLIRIQPSYGAPPTLLAPWTGSSNPKPWVQKTYITCKLPSEYVLLDCPNRGSIQEHDMHSLYSVRCYVIHFKKLRHPSQLECELQPGIV